MQSLYELEHLPQDDKNAFLKPERDSNQYFHFLNMIKRKFNKLVKAADLWSGCGCAGTRGTQLFCNKYSQRHDTVLGDLQNMDVGVFVWQRV